MPLNFSIWVKNIFPNSSSSPFTHSDKTGRTRHSQEQLPALQRGVLTSFSFKIKSRKWNFSTRQSQEASEAEQRSHQETPPAAEIHKFPIFPTGTHSTASLGVAEKITQGIPAFPALLPEKKKKIPEKSELGHPEPQERSGAGKGLEGFLFFFFFIYRFIQRV